MGYRCNERLLQKTAFKCSGSRRELCSPVFTLYNASIPEMPGLRHKKSKTTCIHIKIGGSAPDPLGYDKMASNIIL